LSECIFEGEPVYLREAVVCREGGTTRVIHICASEHLELALAREIRRLDPEQRPVRTSRAFTPEWAEQQLACSNPEPTLPVVATPGSGTS
jgi:hypothetical protein